MQGISVADSGNVFVNGYLGAPGPIGGAPLSFGGALDIFVASYDSALSHRWSESFGAAGDDRGDGGPAIDGN